MPRPKKLNADYFPHDKHMRHHRKLRAIEAQFGLIGYAMWCKLLEVLTDCKHFRMKYNDDELELLAADWGVSVAETSRFIDFCIRLKMIVAENGVLYSPSLIETLHSVLSRREAQAERDRQKSEKNKDSDSTEGVSAAETSRNEQKPADCPSLPIPAPKVKERKGKEIKVKERKGEEREESPHPLEKNSENEKGWEDEDWEFPESEVLPAPADSGHRAESSGPNSAAPPGLIPHTATHTAEEEDSYSTANRTPTLIEVIDFGSANGVPQGACEKFFYHYEACIPAWRARGNDGVPRPFRWPYQLQKWHTENRRSGHGSASGDATGSSASPHTFPTIHTTETWHIWSYDKAVLEYQSQYGTRSLFPYGAVEKGWVVLWDIKANVMRFIPDKWADKGYPTDRYRIHELPPRKSAA